MERDPRQEGQAPWTETTRRLSREWATGLNYILVDIDLAETVQYPFLETVNRIYLEASKNA